MSKRMPAISGRRAAVAEARDPVALTYRVEVTACSFPPGVADRATLRAPGGKCHMTFVWRCPTFVGPGRWYELRIVSWRQRAREPRKSTSRTFRLSGGPSLDSGRRFLCLESEEMILGTNISLVAQAPPDAELVAGDYAATITLLPRKHA